MKNIKEKLLLYLLTAIIIPSIIAGIKLYIDIHDTIQDVKELKITVEKEKEKKIEFYKKFADINLQISEMKWKINTK